MPLSVGSAKPGMAVCLHTCSHPDFVRRAHAEGTSTAVGHTTRVCQHDAWQAHAECDCSTRINWRASLLPAAAVIPAPIAYIQVAAVGKLVVGFRMGSAGPPFLVCTDGAPLAAANFRWQRPTGRRAWWSTSATGRRPAARAARRSRRQTRSPTRKSISDRVQWRSGAAALPRRAMAAGGAHAQILGGETKAPRRQQRRVFRLGAAAAAAGRARDVGASQDGSGNQRRCCICQLRRSDGGSKF